LKLSSQKKILVIAESIDVEDSSGSKANVALIINLKSAGFEVLVYHYTRKEITLDSIPCIAIKENRKSLLFYLSRLQRKFQHIFNWNLAKYLEPWFGFSFTFLNDSKSISNSIRSIKEFDPDLVLTLSKGASFRPHHALLVLPELHDKWMAYIHDPYPFHYYPEPYTWSEPGYKQKVDFFRKVSEKCRWAAFPSLLLAEWMQQPFPQFKERATIIPHQIIKEEHENNLELPEYFDPEKFNLLHAGNLMKQRNPVPLIEAFQIFLKNNPDAINDARLLFLGNGSFYIENLKARQKGIKQLYVSEGYVAYDLVVKMQFETSVNIILESVAEVSPFLPGKFPHCIAAKKPILHLGPEKSEVRRLLGIDYRYWAEANTVEKISSIIENLYFSWKANGNNLEQDRDDLNRYLSLAFLKKQINNLN
jgi:glycosyltransferase involved in cell wall biosynthesis